MDFHFVERGLSWPNCCVICGSQGPGLVDTGVDKPGIAGDGSGFGRVYLCKNVCVKAAASEVGFVKGPRMDELQNASLALEQRDKEIVNRDRRIDKLTEAIAERDRRLKQQQMVIDGQAEKLSTAQHVAGIAAAANTQLAEVFT